MNTPEATETFNQMVEGLHDVQTREVSSTTYPSIKHQDEQFGNVDLVFFSVSKEQDKLVAAIITTEQTNPELKKRIETERSQQLFTYAVIDKPKPGNNLLQITVNSVPIREDLIGLIEYFDTLQKTR